MFRTGGRSVRAARRWLQIFSIAVGFTLIGSPLAAQDPLARALQNYRSQQVTLVENLLFDQTAKTTRIIFAKRFPVSENTYVFCGEAFFGSSRKTFALNTGDGSVVVGAPPRALAARGCNGP